MAMNTISVTEPASNGLNINRRSILKSAVVSLATIPAASVSVAAAVEPEAVAPLYWEYQSLEFGYQNLFDIFEDLDHEDAPRNARREQLRYTILPETPALDFKEVVMKLAAAVEVHGETDYFAADSMLVSAVNDANRLLVEQGLIPEPAEFTSHELEVTRLEHEKRQRKQEEYRAAKAAEAEAAEVEKNKQPTPEEERADRIGLAVHLFNSRFFRSQDERQEAFERIEKLIQA